MNFSLPLHVFVRSLFLAAFMLLPATMAWSQSVANYSNAMSNASGLSVHGSGLVVAGSMETAAASGKLAVQAVEQTADGMIVVLKAAGESAVSAATVSVKLSQQTVSAVSLAAGTIVEVVSEAAGYALLSAGKLIAYIPNEIGRSMVHQQRR